MRRPSYVRRNRSAGIVHAKPTRHGCPVELILKDISAVRYELQRLWEWAKVAMELATDGTTRV